MWKIHHFDETESTNTLALAGAPGDVFTAGHQSAGRGRLDHRWLSPPGENLMMSAVVDAAGMDAAEVATFPLVVGLSVADALAAHSPGLRLKWPNDIVVAAGRNGLLKLAGVLCERHGDNVVAGIGVNVRQARFPAELAGRATSLRLLGSDASVIDVRDAILASLERFASRWRNEGFAALLPQISRLDALKGHVVSIRRTDGDTAPATGMCGGVADDGALVVGSERIYAGEAHLLSIGRQRTRPA